MFIAFGQPRFGAPAERNVLIGKYVEQITFRSAGANNLIDCGVNKHSVPPGLGRLLSGDQCLISTTFGKISRR